MKRSILTLCLLGQVLFLWAQNQYYVAPNGNDNHDGSVVILGGLTFVNFPLCIHLC